MNPIAHLARCFQQSTHGRKEATRDFTIDYEKFLRSCGMADGEERELAERELRRAETASAGLLRIDRHKRTGHAEKIRLAREGGEAWLFAQLNVVAPAEQRAELERFFLTAADQTVPITWQQAWTAWFRQLAELTHKGDSIQPFRRDDADGNQTLVHALSGILHWSSPALIRYASSAICGDSKQLQRLEPRLRIALLAITGSDSLETFGILRKPRFVTFHGPLILQIGSEKTDFAMFPGPVTLAETNFTDQATLSTNASICLTVENEDTFHELAATNPGVILILTSFAGAAVRRMMKLLPKAITFYHFGDSDPAGADIFRDLREKTGHDIRPLLLHNDKSRARQPLTSTQSARLERLVDMDLPIELQMHIAVMLDEGMPRDYEQESIPIDEVWKALELATGD